MIDEQKNKRRNLPNVAIDDIEQGTASGIMLSLDNMSNLFDNGKTAKQMNNAELEERLKRIVQYGIDNDVRIGVELLSLGLGISRQTFYRWSNGIDCDTERAQICQKYRQFVSAYIEQLALKGKINPAISIFALKNIAGWQDVTTERIEYSTERQALSVNDLPQLSKEKLSPLDMSTSKELIENGEIMIDKDRNEKHGIWSTKTERGEEYL